MMGCSLLMPKMYTIAESVNAPAPSAMAERSMVIHKPHGTESLRFVMTSPSTRTRIAEYRPITNNTARRPIQSSNVLLKGS